MAGRAGMSNGDFLIVCLGNKPVAMDGIEITTVSSRSPK
jgi:hypothetical protein